MSVYKTDPKGPTYLGEFARILPAEEGEPTPRKWNRPDTPVKMEIRRLAEDGVTEYRIVELVPTHTLIKRHAGSSGNAFQHSNNFANANTRRWLLWNDPDACEVAARKVGLDLHDFEQPGVELLRFLGREVHQNPESLLRLMRDSAGRLRRVASSHDRGDVPLVEQSMSEWIDFYMGPEA
jgi:hypothetical protein